MKFKDLIAEVIFSILSNKTRAALTVLGIVIGIGSVIAMISIGEGAQKSIESNIESMGSNLIMVTSGFNRSSSPVSSGRGNAQTLTLNDYNEIKDNVTNISYSTPQVSSRYQVVNGKNNTNTQIIGVNNEYEKVRNVILEGGDFFDKDQDASSARVAIVGYTTAQDLFKEDYNIEAIIGKTIKINRINFKIIGVTKVKQTSGGFGSQDDQILIPFTTFNKYLQSSEYVSSIFITSDSKENMNLLQQDVKNLLMKEHKIKDESSIDFNITNQSDIIATASSITGTLTSLLSAIAAISLLVGGIGIMNMMLTNVTERTKEIGLRKSVGARERDIKMQFLFESIVLTFIGGVFGIALGFLVAYIMTTFVGIATSVSMYSVFLSISVSCFIGIIFGYYPASRAAKLNPIDALRYE